MRFVVIVVAALLSLGLAAFGVVSAQKAAAPNAASANMPGEAAANTQRRFVDAKTARLPARSPVSQIAQAPVSEIPAAAAAPRRLPPRRCAWPRPHPRKAQPRPLPPRAPANAPTAEQAGHGGRRSAARAIFPRATDPAAWDFRASSRSTRPADPGSASSTSSNTTFSARRRSCSRSTTARGRRIPRRRQGAHRQCLKATFFEIGEHAMWHPGDHQAGDRSRRNSRHPHLVAQRSGPKSLRKRSRESQAGNRDGQQRRAYGRCGQGLPVAAFFRFPDLQHPPARSLLISANATSRYSRPTSTRSISNLRSPSS